MPGPTAPKWAQALGIQTRNRALEFQALAMGFDTRAEFERARKVALEDAGPARKKAWRDLLKAQQDAEAAQVKNADNQQELIERAQALKYELNRTLPEEHRLASPKARES